MSSPSPSGATRFTSCPHSALLLGGARLGCLPIGVVFSSGIRQTGTWIGCISGRQRPPVVSSHCRARTRWRRLLRRGRSRACARNEAIPPASLFNWRFPIYAWFLGAFPGPEGGRWLLVALASVTLCFAFKMCLAEAGPLRAILGALLLGGVFSWSFDGDAYAYFAQELWAGVLVFLSVSALSLQHRALGVLAGLLALFMRELAGPYVLVCAVLAFWGRRKAEAALWVIGLVLYGCLLSYHAAQVHQRLTPADRLGESWLQWGGAAFVLDTVRMNEWLFRTPTWVRAIYLPAALLGLLGWRRDRTPHGCVCSWVLLFICGGGPAIQRLLGIARCTAACGRRGSRAACPARPGASPQGERRGVSPP